MMLRSDTDLMELTHRVVSNVAKALPVTLVAAYTTAAALGGCHYGMLSQENDAAGRFSSA